jgi:glycosyltransferase involved in cell wall biosynthesis
MVGSLPEIIQPNMGFLVKPKNHAELRAAIESCIESRGSLKNMGDNCRDWIVRQHSWGAFSDGVRELYK